MRGGWAGVNCGTRWPRYLSATSLLFIDGELSAAILLPARFVRLGAELLFLAEADDAELTGSNACADQSRTGCVGAVFAECEVVLSRTTLVGEAADDNAQTGGR